MSILHQPNVFRPHEFLPKDVKPNPETHLPNYLLTGGSEGDGESQQRLEELRGLRREDEENVAGSHRNH